MAGEKHVPIKQWGIGPLDSSTYNGDNAMCYLRGATNEIGVARMLDDPGWKFGSYHTAVCQFVLCDGSVQAITNTISPAVLTLLCWRADGQVIPDY